ncbi:MAG: NAD-dependent epimerase/dehydratase family protein [Planctomycetota bacterium]
MSFYANKNVLVTGGASFIGSHLVDALVEDGAHVTVVDDLSSGVLDNLDLTLKKIKFIEGDLRIQSVADESTQGAEIVFHLANIHGGRGFIETHPGEIVQNFMIDGNVFYFSHKNGVERVCYTSSACAYPTNLQGDDPEKQIRYLSEEMADPFKEGAALADGEYGWAKFMGEMALKAYNKQFSLRGVSCRLFTVYGPRENESHAIIAFISRALLRQDPYEIWGSGQQDRNFTYVDDIVQGLLRATERITDCRAVNLGTDEITKIADAARTVCGIVGHEPEEYYFDLTKPEGVYARAASIKNQKKWLGWTPQMSFADGIQKTVDWYAQNVDLEALRVDFERRLFER